uniref:Uncharacterized protein n=1 Tax=Gasterosteus aculeatus TaxID=69293 RepID=G3Q1M5_GASAC
MFLLSSSEKHRSIPPRQQHRPAGLVPSRRHAVPQLVVDALAEPVDHDHDEAGGDQAHQQQPDGGPLHDEQVDPHGQRAEVQQAQHPHQHPGRGLAQLGRAVPRRPPVRDGRRGVQAGGAEAPAGATRLAAEV